MTYAEAMAAAEKMEIASNATKSKPRGASRATLAMRAKRLALCCFCGEPLATHTVSQMQDCSNGRS